MHFSVLLGNPYMQIGKILYLKSFSHEPNHKLNDYFDKTNFFIFYFFILLKTTAKLVIKRNYSKMSSRLSNSCYLENKHREMEDESWMTGVENVTLDENNESDLNSFDTKENIEKMTVNHQMLTNLGLLNTNVSKLVELGVQHNRERVCKVFF